MNGPCFRWVILTLLIPLTTNVLSFKDGLPFLHAAWKAEYSFPNPSRLVQGGISVIVCSVRYEGRRLISQGLLAS